MWTDTTWKPEGIAIDHLIFASQIAATGGEFDGQIFLIAAAYIPEWASCIAFVKNPNARAGSQVRTQAIRCENVGQACVRAVLSIELMAKDAWDVTDLCHAGHNVETRD